MRVPQLRQNSRPSKSLLLQDNRIGSLEMFNLETRDGQIYK